MGKFFQITNEGTGDKISVFNTHHIVRACQRADNEVRFYFTDGTYEQYGLTEESGRRILNNLRKDSS